MGSDQSSQSSRRERVEREERERARRNNRETTANVATARDVEVALEQQRKLYEQKMKDILEEQKKQSKRKIDILVLQANRRESTSAVAATRQQSPLTANAILERERAPYSHSRNELQSAVNDPNQRCLYPNLGASAFQGSTSASPRPTNSNTPGYFTGGQENFVFANSHFSNNNQQQVPAQRPDFRPSAPPSETTSTSSNKTNFRPRSQSRHRDQNDDIKCPTCGKMFGERIYQCNNGHSSCHLCKMRQVPCGQCRLQLTDRRNFDLEKYIIERLQKKVKCPNSTEGCRLYVKIAELESHAKECPFNVQKCPSLGSCNWNGKLSQLSSHFQEMHPMHLQGEVDTEMFMSNISDTSHTMHYVRIGSFNFLFHVMVSGTENRIYMAAQLIGTKYSASKWDYEIHIYNKSEPRRKFQYIDRCSSSYEPIQEITKSTKCAVIPLQFAKTFICGGVLAYKFYIKKEDEVKTKEFVNSNIENKGLRNFKKHYPKKN